LELSLDDPNISVESDDVIYGKRNTHNKKRKKFNCNRNSKIDQNNQNNFLNESDEEGGGEDEFNTQEQRTPTKKRRNVYFPNTLNKKNYNCQNDGGDKYNENNHIENINHDRNYNDNHDNHARPVHTSSVRKQGDKGTLENTDMVRYPCHFLQILCE
jgi:hypothetical protein